MGVIKSVILLAVFAPPLVPPLLMIPFVNKGINSLAIGGKAPCPQSDLLQLWLINISSTVMLQASCILYALGGIKFLIIVITAYG
jgi:hypothetical protein